MQSNQPATALSEHRWLRIDNPLELRVGDGALLNLDDTWIWDFWIADTGKEYHIYFLKASKEYRDPLTRHDLIRNPDRRQKRSSIGHAVSKDLISWELLPDALHHGEPGTFDDLATWTGSVLQGPDEIWYMFYTGISSESEGKLERIGLATSDDLYSWEKRQDLSILSADHRWYEKLGDSSWPNETWRDPWVFRDPDGDGWHMYITARSRDGSVDDRGVIGHAHSENLLDWEILPPLSEPGGGFGDLEVSQINVISGKPLLLFSCLRREFSENRCSMGEAGGGAGGVWALPCESILGPFNIPEAKLLTDNHLYSGRLIKDHDDRWLFMAFVNERENEFVGQLSDPFEFSWTDSGDFLLKELDQPSPTDNGADPFGMPNS